MNTEQERRDFECFMSDGGKFPQAIERDANGNYVLMQAASSWHVWQARAALQSQKPNIRDDLHLSLILDMYDNAMQKAFDGREFSNPCVAGTWEAKAWDKGKKEGKKKRDAGLPHSIALQSQDREDAERYRWLRDPCSGAEHVIFYSRGDYGKGLMSGVMLDEAIDHARRIEGES